MDLNSTNGDSLPTTPDPEFVKAVRTICDSLNSHEFFAVVTDLAHAYLGIEEEDDESDKPPFSDLLPEGSTTLKWDTNLVSIYRSRIPRILTEENGWVAHESNPPYSRVVSDYVDGDGEPIATYPPDVKLHYYNKSRNISLAFEEDDYFVAEINFKIRGNVTPDDKKWITELIEEPNPYRGKVCSTNGKSIVKIALKNEPLNPYPDTVEQDIKWFTSVADPEVRGRLQDAGLPVKSGLLLVGPPGSGKTSLARRVAQDLTADPNSETTVLFVDPMSDMDGVFSIASNFDSVMIVFEDVESFTGERGQASFTEFLNCLDGVEDSTNTMVLATTNDASQLDPAVVRAGRLERTTTIDSVYEGFLPSILADKFAGATPEEVDALASAITGKEACPTPAQVDYIARSAIMSRMTPTEAAEWVRNEWEATSEAHKSWIH